MGSPMSVIIDLLVTACLTAYPASCTSLRKPTTFVSQAQCQLHAEHALQKIMEAYPERSVAKYACVVRNEEHVL